MYCEASLVSSRQQDYFMDECCEGEIFLVYNQARGWAGCRRLYIDFETPHGKAQ